MAFATNLDHLQPVDNTTTEVVDELLNKNLLTTAGVCAAGLTVSYGAIVVTTALPLKMLGGAAVAATLVIAGDQKAKDNLKMPTFGKKKEEKEATTEVAAEA